MALKTLYGKILPNLVIGFAVLTAKKLLQRPTVRSTLRGQVRKMLTGSREKPYQPIAEIEDNADRILDILHRKGVHPDSVCIDGPPGSGKSSIGRALSERCGLKWRTLYWQELKEDFNFKSGRIYENIRLIRTQDMEHFDVVLYLDCAIDEARERVITRERVGALADVVDFDKLKAVGDTAFEMLAGDEIMIEKSSVRIKIKPPDGYGDIGRLKKLLQVKGFDVEGFSKEELLFLYCYGKPEKGISPYVKLGAYNNEIVAGLWDSLVKAFGQRY